jgi:hypothetical protein
MKKVLFVAIITGLFACKKTSEDFPVPPSIAEYAPLKVGKFITYDLDSLLFLGGTQEIHRKYEVKYLVTDSVNDNLGRKVFRIVRSIRSLSTNPFLPDNTSYAINTGTNFEFTENNLRFFKLIQPIKNDATWKGNSAVSTSSSGTNLSYLFDWDYTFAKVGEPAKVNNVIIPNTITINQADKGNGLPVILPTQSSNPTTIASKDSAVEIYAKDIGMVYKKLLHWDYQLSSNNNNYAFTGYGITLEMKDHN